MKNFLFQFLRFSITFLCLVVLFNSLMYAISSFSSDLIEDNIKKSAEIIYKQRDFINTGFLSVVENVTDGLQVNEAYSIDSTNPLESYLLIRKNYKKGQTQIVLPDAKGTLVSYSENKFDDEGNPVRDSDFTIKHGKYEVVRNYKIVDELYNFVNGKVTISQTYSRYYHGYLAIFRPLFLFFDVTGVRIFMTSVLILLFLINTFLIYKKIGLRLAVVFFSVIISFGYTGICWSLQQGPLFLVIMISLLIQLLNIEKYNKKQMYFHLFVTACFANFIDFFTTPVLSLAIPLVVFYAYSYEHDNVFELQLDSFFKCLLELITFGIVWSLGFGLTWISKFVITEIFCHTDAIAGGINQILYRTGGKIDSFDYLINEVIIPFTFKSIAISSLVFVLITFIFEKIKLCVPTREEIKNHIWFILIATIPLAWMTIILNHTLYHFDLFPYRNLTIAMMVVFYLVTAEKSVAKKKEK